MVAIIIVVVFVIVVVMQRLPRHELVIRMTNSRRQITR